MARLNYHHLGYFWQVAKLGNLTKAANLLHVSQSALSSQIMQLEESMDVKLFSREGRKLVLTEMGHLTYSYAESIFTKGDELESVLLKGLQPDGLIIRIGMLSTMSRNFTESFMEPLIKRPNTKYILAAKDQTNLLNSLANHQLDIALTNIEVRGTEKHLWQCQLIARQPISLIGPPGLDLGSTLSEGYNAYEWILPVSDSPIRSAFDGFCAQYQLQPKIVGEADDMAMLRLLARDSGAIAVMPEVVVKDELLQGRLKKYMTLPNVFENFYAVSIKRQLDNPIIS